MLGAFYDLCQKNRSLRAWELEPNDNISFPIGTILTVQQYYERLDLFDLFKQFKERGIDINSLCVITEDSRTGCDDDPTISNIEEAFSWLENTSESSSQPVIYISDHVIWTMGNATFQFSDGNLSANTIDGWLNSTQYQDLTMILNGNRSALAGPDLKDSSREIFCSMRSTQSFDEDLFNITRGLNDPTSDIDDDGDVSYHEAYLKECYNLRNEDQSPISYTE